MKIIVRQVGMLATNCYIIFDEKNLNAFVIDPAAEATRILKFIREHKLKVCGILNTHGHGDHIGANDELREATGAPLYINEKDAVMLDDPKKNLSFFTGFPCTSKPADYFLHEGDVLETEPNEDDEKIFLRVLEIPGHSPGGVAFVCDAAKCVFAGDALFQGSIGRTDFPGSSHQDLIKNIQDKLFTLPDETVVFPGHGGPTQIGLEKQFNPFF